MKKNKLKEYIKKFKEIWSYPRYRAIIKLSLYGIMFLIIIIMANISSGINNEEKNNTKSFTEILNATNLENSAIEYNIKVNGIEYKIEGQIKNNVLTGYIENNDNIKKIKLENNTIFNIGNNSEIIDQELNNLLIKDFLLPKKIIELINNETAYIEKNATNIFYTYEIIHNSNQYEIKLTTNLEVFDNISIKNSNTEYNLIILTN